MKDTIRRLLDDTMLATTRLRTYNEIIDATTTEDIDGHGLNKGVDILYAMTTTIYREIENVDSKLKDLYKIVSDIKESENNHNE